MSVIGIQQPWENSAVLPSGKSEKYYNDLTSKKKWLVGEEKASSSKLG